MEDPTLQAKSNAKNTNEKNMDGELNKLAVSIGGITLRDRWIIITAMAAS
mgnify:CR=1 FL=1